VDGRWKSDILKFSVLRKETDHSKSDTR